MKARDVMSPVNDYLRTDMSIRDAILKMRQVKRVHGLPIKGMLVKDEQGKVVGMLSIKDIMAAVIPSYLSPDLSVFSWDDMLEQMIKRAADKTVGDIMVREIESISSDAPLMEAADLMIKKHLQRLPVTDEQNEIIGMVYLRDIYNFIVDTFIQEEA